MAIFQNYRNGEHAVVLTPEGKVRDVVKVFKTGKTDRISSYQEVQVDDIVVSSDGLHDPDTKERTQILWFATVKQVTRQKVVLSEWRDTIPLTDVTFLTNLLTQDMSSLFQWVLGVAPYGTSTSLPAGYGWDGEYTEKEKDKLIKLNSLLVDNGYNEDAANNAIRDKLISTAMVSPYGGLVTDWELAQPIPRDPLVMPPMKDTVAYIVIRWLEDGTVAYGHITDEQSLTETIDIDISSYNVERALVGTFYSTPYGDNVRWKLYR